MWTSAKKFSETPVLQFRHGHHHRHRHHHHRHRRHHRHHRRRRHHHHYHHHHHHYHHHHHSHNIPLPPPPPPPPPPHYHHNHHHHHHQWSSKTPVVNIWWELEWNNQLKSSFYGLIRKWKVTMRTCCRGIIRGSRSYPPDSRSPDETINSKYVFLRINFLIKSIDDFY